MPEPTLEPTTTPNVNKEEVITPEVVKDDNSWSIIDIISTVVSVMFALIALFAKKETINQTQGKDVLSRRKMYFAYISLVGAIHNVILCYTLHDFSGTVVLYDSSTTPLFLMVCILVILFGSLSLRYYEVHE